MHLEPVDLLGDFTQEQVAQLSSIIDRYRGKPGNLIPVLEEAQLTLEYLPVKVQQFIAQELNLPVSRVFGVVTFYSFFTMKPRGRHTIRVCLGTACYVRGGKTICDLLKKELKVEEGETTSDRRFTFETVRCLGACGLGPVVVVDHDVHGRMKPARLAEILSRYK